MKGHFVYIVASKSKNLYIGVTNNLECRLFEHKTKKYPGFTAKYNIDRLVYYACHDTHCDAIVREKQLKNWRRQWKINLIEQDNPYWEDISEEWGDPEINSG